MLEDVTVTCPHCWEEISLSLDLSVEEQSYIEDCPVCCRPLQITCTVNAGELDELTVEQSA